MKARRNDDGITSDYTVDLSQQLYRMWHEKMPQESFSEKVDIPPSMFAVGEATHIIYESDKWEDDGDYHRYIHKFTSRPTLYAQNGAVLPDDVEPFDEMESNRLLGVTRVAGKYGFPVLANVHQLTWDDGQCVRKLSFRSYQPVMSCSVDQQTLVIFADELLMVHGGSMVVSAPGIID